MESYSDLSDEPGTGATKIVQRRSKRENRNFGVIQNDSNDAERLQKMSTLQSKRNKSNTNLGLSPSNVAKANYDSPLNRVRST